METKDLPGYIRTIVPMIVGWLGALLTDWGWDWTNQAVTQFVVVIIGAAYYIIVRLLESKWPAAGKLLGVARTPVY